MRRPKRIKFSNRIGIIAPEARKTAAHNETVGLYHKMIQAPAGADRKSDVEILFRPCRGFAIHLAEIPRSTVGYYRSLLHSLKQICSGNFQKTHHSVAVLENFDLQPRSDDFQRVTFRVAEHQSSAGREQFRQIFIIKQLLRK